MEKLWKSGKWSKIPKVTHLVQPLYGSINTWTDGRSIGTDSVNLTADGGGKYSVNGPGGEHPKAIQSSKIVVLHYVRNSWENIGAHQVEYLPQLGY